MSKATFDIQQALITDPLGNTTRVSFTNIDRETALEDDLFRFELPPGMMIWLNLYLVRERCATAGPVPCVWAEMMPRTEKR